MPKNSLKLIFLDRVDFLLKINFGTSERVERSALIAYAYCEGCLSCTFYIVVLPLYPVCGLKGGEGCLSYVCLFGVVNKALALSLFL